MDSLNRGKVLCKGNREPAWLLDALQAHNLKVAGSNPAPATISRMYQAYILTNPTGRIYIGISEDPAVRVSQHNEGLSKWTRGKGPWALSWTSKPMSLSEARKLENLLKRQKGGSGLDKIKSLRGS